MLIDPFLGGAEKAAFPKDDVYVSIAMGTPPFELTIILIEAIKLVAPKPISLKRKCSLKKIDVIVPRESSGSERLECQLVQFADDC